MDTDIVMLSLPQQQFSSYTHGRLPDFPPELLHVIFWYATRTPKALERAHREVSYIPFQDSGWNDTSETIRARKEVWEVSSISHLSTTPQPYPHRSRQPYLWSANHGILSLQSFYSKISQLDHAYLPWKCWICSAVGCAVSSCRQSIQSTVLLGSLTYSVDVHVSKHWQSYPRQTFQIFGAGSTTATLRSVASDALTGLRATQIVASKSAVPRNQLSCPSLPALQI